MGLDYNAGCCRIIYKTSFRTFISDDISEYYAKGEVGNSNHNTVLYLLGDFPVLRPRLTYIYCTILYVALVFLKKIG